MENKKPIKYRKLPQEAAENPADSATSPAETAQTEQPNTEGVSSLLDASKDRFKAICVVGVKDNGAIDIVPSYANYQFTHWILNRAIFELNFSEKAQIDGFAS